MRKHTLFALPALMAVAGAALGQQIAAQTQAPVATSQAPVTVALAAPQVSESKVAPASYEERLKAAEARFPRTIYGTASLKTDIMANPWMAYVGAFERAQIAKADDAIKAGNTPSLQPVSNGNFQGSPSNRTATVERPLCGRG